MADYEKINPYMIERDRLQRENDMLRGLVGELVDPEPCSYDHHGSCQEHGWSNPESPCPHKRAQDLLRADAALKGGAE